MDISEEQKTMDREEKMRLAELKMEEMRYRNEKLKKRYEEVEADKKNANISSKMAGLKLSESAHEKSKDAATHPYLPPRHVVVTPPQKFADPHHNTNKKEKSIVDILMMTSSPTTPPSDPSIGQQQPTNQQPPLLVLGKSRGRKLSVEGGGGGGPAVDSAYSTSNQIHRTLTGDGPPPDPKFRFLLDDPDRKEILATNTTKKVEDQQKSQQTSATAAAADFGGSRGRGGGGGAQNQNVVQRQRSFNDGRQQQSGGGGGGFHGFIKKSDVHPNNAALAGGGGLSKKDMEMHMTGSERLRYQAWLKEREQVDADRMARQQTSDGHWRREWDADKKIDDFPDDKSMSIGGGNFQTSQPQQRNFQQGDRRSSNSRGNENVGGGNFGSGFNNQQQQQQSWRPRRYSDNSGKNESDGFNNSSNNSSGFSNSNFYDNNHNNSKQQQQQQQNNENNGGNRFGNVTFTNSTFERTNQQQQKPTKPARDWSRDIGPPSSSSNRKATDNEATPPPAFLTNQEEEEAGGFKRSSPVIDHAQERSNSDKQQKTPKYGPDGFAGPEFSKVYSDEQSHVTEEKREATPPTLAEFLDDDDQWEDVQEGYPVAPGGLQKWRAKLRQGGRRHGAPAPTSDSDEEAGQFEDAVEHTPPSRPRTPKRQTPTPDKGSTPVDKWGPTATATPEKSTMPTPPFKDEDPATTVESGVCPDPDDDQLAREMSPRKDSIDQIERDMINTLNENILAVEAALDKQEDDFDAIMYNDPTLTTTMTSLTVPGGTGFNRKEPVMMKNTEDGDSPTAPECPLVTKMTTTSENSNNPTDSNVDVKLCMDGLLANV